MIRKKEHSIELSPDYINDKSDFGHWQLDTVIGKKGIVRFGKKKKRSIEKGTYVFKLYA